MCTAVHVHKDRWLVDGSVAVNGCCSPVHLMQECLLEVIQELGTILSQCINLQGHQHGARSYDRAAVARSGRNKHAFWMCCSWGASMLSVMQQCSELKLCDAACHVCGDTHLIIQLILL